MPDGNACVQVEHRALADSVRSCTNCNGAFGSTPKHGANGEQNADF